jgi:ABC-2 type transport system ATP-binding protein
MLELDSISHYYGRKRALSDLSLTLQPGVVALLGINGAGKTTVLSIAGGALKPTVGNVRLEGTNLYGRDRKKRLTSVAIMPQRLNYPSKFRVREFVTYIGYLRGLSWREAATASEDALEQVGLSGRAGDRLSHLSGGMLRRVALAQALVTQPKVLMLDEPTTGLDPEQRVAIRRLIRNVLPNVIVLLSSHIIEDVESLAERIIILNKGSVVFDGAPAELDTSASPSANSASVIEASFLRLVREGPQS